MDIKENHQVNNLFYKNGEIEKKNSKQNFVIFLDSKGNLSAKESL